MRCWSVVGRRARLPDPRSSPPRLLFPGTQPTIPAGSPRFRSTPMALATFRPGRGSRPACVSLAIAALLLPRATALAQVDPKADPTSTLLNERHPAEHPATLVVQPQPA